MKFVTPLTLFKNGGDGLRFGNPAGTSAAGEARARPLLVYAVHILRLVLEEGLEELAFSEEVPDG